MRTPVLDILEKGQSQAHLRRAPKGGLQGFKGGWFLTNDLWQSERRKAAESLAPLLNAFGEDLQFLRGIYEQNTQLMQEGKTEVSLVPMDSLEDHMKRRIADSYSRAFLLGKKASGNLTSATEAEMHQVKQIRLDEYQYLHRFLTDIRKGEGKLPYQTRMDMYRAAAREIYNLGYVLGNMKPGRLIVWNLGPTEHCETCLKMAGKHPVEGFVKQVIETGYLPQSGKLDCIGYYCQCYLTEEFETVSRSETGKDDPTDEIPVPNVD